MKVLNNSALCLNSWALIPYLGIYVSKFRKYEFGIDLGFLCFKISFRFIFNGGKP